MNSVHFEHGFRANVFLSSYDRSLKLASLSDLVMQYCGVKLAVINGYVQPPAVIPSNNLSLHYEGRAADIRFATTPLSRCLIPPSPLTLGDHCYEDQPCQSVLYNGVSAIMCPFDGYTSYMGGNCTCVKECSANLFCNCGILHTDIAPGDQCSSEPPTLNGCYCVNDTASQLR